MSLNTCILSILIIINCNQCLQVPKNFKNMTSRAQKMYKKLLDPEPSRRLSLCDVEKYLEDRWLRKGFNKPEDEQSQLTLGSFQVN